MKLWMMLFSVFIGGLTTHCFAEQTPYCSLSQSCWPTDAQWNELNQQVHGHLIKGNSPLASCIHDPKNPSCKTALEAVKNPFFLESQAGATQSNGWVGAWKTAVSPYVIVAESPDEIAKAVNFARQHHIKLVVKGTGHDYLGRSNAVDSLLVWTHKMRKITMQPHFIPQNCPKTHHARSAVTVEAGTRWLEVYNAVVVNNGLYVQGGGCTSVGAAGGFIQGGGFGSFSKKFGTGAAGILEAEIVTADGKILIANECTNKDLYWALKGGGGGTFGIVSKITLQTHALPALFGALSGTIIAKTDKDYKQLIDYFIKFYRTKLHNDHWGEQVIFSPKNELQLALIFQGLNKTEVGRLWQPFKEWLAKKPNQYQFTMNSVTVPARQFWDFDYLEKNLPSYITVDKRKNAPHGEFWWAGNQSEVSIYLTHYQSGYVPFRLFEEKHASSLSDALFEASRLIRLSLHFNKGLSGASDDAIVRQKKTAMNPAVLDATALVTISGGQQYTYDNIPGHEPNLDEAKISASNALKAMKLIHKLSPDSGTYGNEADYNLKDWHLALWGSNYKKLLKIKHQYDPLNVFNCHHCVGSD